MELKSKQGIFSDKGLDVLIVPLWNWNSQGDCGRTQQGGSNCTFMELKLLTTYLDAIEKQVLIVPLWNWNRPLQIPRAGALKF